MATTKRRTPPATKAKPKPVVPEAARLRLPVDTTARLVAEMRAVLSIMLSVQHRLNLYGLFPVWLTNDDGTLGLRFEMRAEDAKPKPPFQTVH